MRKNNPEGTLVVDTKKNIITAARFLFSNFGYLGVSMTDIAKKLNITKAALYYHFSSKDEIYNQVLQDVLIELSNTITKALDEQTVDSKLEHLIKNYLDFGFKEKTLIRAFVINLTLPDFPQYIEQLREKVIDLIQPVIKELSKVKKSGHINSRLITSVLTSMLDGIILETSLIDKKINSQEISTQVVAIIFNKRLKVK